MVSRAENANLFEVVADGQPVNDGSTRIGELCAELEPRCDPCAAIRLDASTEAPLRLDGGNASLPGRGLTPRVAIYSYGMMTKAAAVGRG